MIYQLYTTKNEFIKEADVIPDYFTGIAKNRWVDKWYRNGGPHRIEGPAVVWRNASEEWWVNNQRHRIGGPAFILKHIKYWFINGREVTKLEHDLLYGIMKLKNYL